MRFPDARRRLLLCAVTVIALFLVHSSLERMRGYIRYTQVLEIKDGWHDEGGIPHDRELNDGFKLGYGAAEHEDSNAEYRYLIASLHAWREKGLRLWPKQAKAESRKVIENLKAALIRRPTWYEAWILIALVKFQLGELDHELEIVLEKAIETGRYETVVQHGVSIVALGLWDRLRPDLRDRAEETLQISLANTNINRFVVERIVTTGHVGQFRETLESNERLWDLTERLLEKHKDAT